MSNTLSGSCAPSNRRLTLCSLTLLATYAPYCVLCIYTAFLPLLSLPSFPAILISLPYLNQFPHFRIQVLASPPRFQSRRSAFPTFFSTTTNHQHTKMNSSPQTAFASSFTGLSVRPSSSTLSQCPATQSPRRPRRSTPVAVLGTDRATAFGVTSTTKKYKLTILGKSADKNKVIEVEEDTDLRSALKAERIDLYTMGGKLRNCGGGGQCGTCLVAIEDGAYYAGVRTAREEFLLQSKPDNWRLACRTVINGDVTIRTKPQA